MSKKENIESINAKISSGFEKVEKKLGEAKTVAELFAFLLAEIENEFEVPFVWLTFSESPKAAPVIEAVKASGFLKDRLNIVKPELFQEIFSSGLKPVLTNKNLNQYYKLFPGNKKYFVKSLALVPFKMNNEVIGSWNNGDAVSDRYTPDMDTHLLQKLARSVSLHLSKLAQTK